MLFSAPHPVSEAASYGTILPFVEKKHKMHWGVLFCRSKAPRARDDLPALGALSQDLRQQCSHIFPPQNNFSRIALHFPFGGVVQHALPTGQVQFPDGERTILPVPGSQAAADRPQLHAVAFQSVGHGVELPQQLRTPGAHFRQVQQFTARRRKMQPHQTAALQILQRLQQRFPSFHRLFACPDTSIPPFHYLMYDTPVPFPHPTRSGTLRAVYVKIRCLFLPGMI